MTDAAPEYKTQRRGIIVIGASAGGLQPLQRVLSDLPIDLRVAVFVVLYVGGTSRLADVLGRVAVLPVVAARSGLPMQRGRVYVAVPGVHLLLHDTHILLRRGPREHLARPAIEPLLRSAACTFGARVIGVVLSGALSDGTAGLLAIKRCGGMAVAQQPDDAAVPSMPLNALADVDIDHVAPAAALGGLLARLAREPTGITPPNPLEIRLETAIAAQEPPSIETDEQLGEISRFTCPECGGSLWEIDDGSLLRYRCHVGHAYTPDAVLHAQSNNAEEMLWTLMRSHQERSALARRMAQQESFRGRDALAEDLLQRARGYDEDAELVRRLLRDHTGVVETRDTEQDAT